MPYEPHFTITSDLLSVVEEIAALRKKIYQSVDELQDDLDEWLVKYNTQRTHQGTRENADGNTHRRKTNLEGKVFELNLT